MKTCSLCPEKHFAKGFCEPHYKRAWELANPDKKKAYRTRPEARARAIARKRAWYVVNRDKARADMKARYAALRDEQRAKNRAWYESNKERVKREAAAWNAAHPDAVKAYKANYKARKRNADGSHTGAEIAALFIKQRGLCVTCRALLGTSYHRDHIQPLSAGGSNWIENIQLLCASCNTSKSDRDPVEFARSRGINA